MRFLGSVFIIGVAGALAACSTPLATITSSTTRVVNDCPPPPPECHTITQPQVEALFDRWNASLKTLDPLKVEANYEPDAVLLPTLSNKPRTTPTEIEDYFTHFLQKHPQGTITSRTIRTGCNWAEDVGTYTFHVTNPDGTKADVPARYSFVYIYDGKDWKIEHQHSSAMPEKTAASS